MFSQLSAASRRRQPDVAGHRPPARANGTPSGALPRAHDKFATAGDMTGAPCDAARYHWPGTAANVLWACDAAGSVRK